ASRSALFWCRESGARSDRGLRAPQGHERRGGRALARTGFELRSCVARSGGGVRRATTSLPHRSRCGDALFVAQTDLAGLDAWVGSPILIHRQPVSLLADRELPKVAI